MRPFKFIFLFFIFCFSVSAQKLDKDKKYNIIAVGFWNVENFYDTINDPMKQDEEFTPEGTNVWTGDRYRTKIDRLAEAISQMATDATPDGLALMGFCEIENKTCLNDLVKHPKLKPRNYKVILLEGPDARGVDPGFIYNPNYFKPTKVLSYHTTVVTDTAHKTRDELVVTGLMYGEPVAVIVNHWPSRRGGEMASRPNRVEAGRTARRIADSITKAAPETKIMIMGDLNDDPTNESVKRQLNTFGDLNHPGKGDFFNPMESMYEQGIGTIAWEDAWNLFDQIIINKPMLPSGYKTFQYYTVRIFNKPFLRADFGSYKGYPFHTYSGGKYTGGYSDHFPVYILLAKEHTR
ncbi:MAG: endonuclease/exonuclease/phosphatase family protein [Bacteroidia bacterium]